MCCKNRRGWWATSWSRSFFHPWLHQFKSLAPWHWLELGQGQMFCMVIPCEHWEALSPKWKGASNRMQQGLQSQIYCLVWAKPCFSNKAFGILGAWCFSPKASIPAWRVCLCWHPYPRLMRFDHEDGWTPMVCSEMGRRRGGQILAMHFGRSVTV